MPRSFRPETERLLREIAARPGETPAALARAVYPDLSRATGARRIAHAYDRGFIWRASCGKDGDAERLPGCPRCRHVHVYLTTWGQHWLAAFDGLSMGSVADITEADVAAYRRAAQSDN